MIYILLSVLCSTCILVVFRLGDKVGANTRHTIIVGYLVAALAGMLIFSVSPADIFSPWFIPAAIEGIAFYAVFRLIALSAQTSGISVTGVASKMGVIIPIVVGITLLGETINSLIILGIICGLAAVYLTVDSPSRSGDWRWPLLVFIGAGTIDASLKLFQVWGLTTPEFPAFLTIVFFFAFLTSLAHQLLYKKRAVNRASMVSGLILGLTNLGSVYFLLLALSFPEFDSVFVYSLNNFGVVILAVLVATLAFREQISVKGRVGLVLAVASIALLYWAYA